MISGLLQKCEYYFLTFLGNVVVVSFILCIFAEKLILW